jgi:hypothetical protein
MFWGMLIGGAFPLCALIFYTIGRTHGWDRCAAKYRENLDKFFDVKAWFVEDKDGHDSLTFDESHAEELAEASSTYREKVIPVPLVSVAQYSRRTEPVDRFGSASLKRAAHQLAEASLVLDATGIGKDQS